VKRLAPILSAAAAVALLSVLALPACLDRGDSGPDGKQKSVTNVQQPEDALDEALMVTLLKAKNFHHKANVYEMNGRIAKAAAEIGKILTIKFPVDAPEAVDAVLDARARLAKLKMRLGKHDEAMKIVDAGLKAAKRDSFFKANLYTVKGQLHEARAHALKDATDEKSKADFKAHSRAAIVNLDKSIAINEAIQKRLMKAIAP